jgi:beta-galactosidase
LLPIRVLSVETLRADCAESLSWNGQIYESCRWREHLDAGATEVIAEYHNGEPAIVRNGNITYLGTLTNSAFLIDFLQQKCQEAKIETYRFGNDIRVSQRGSLMFAFNYSDQSYELPLTAGTTLLLGGKNLAPLEIAVWQAPDKTSLLK